MGVEEAGGIAVKTVDVTNSQRFVTPSPQSLAPSPLVGEGWGGGAGWRGNDVYRDLARKLRKTMTDAERRLWYDLRHRQIGHARFRRQAPIGPYIVDFVCFEKRLIIELDGGQHAVHVEEDLRRTNWLTAQGFRVLRFWNHQVFEEGEAVLEGIGLALDPPPQPSPTRGEGARIVGCVESSMTHHIADWCVIEDSTHPTKKVMRSSLADSHVLAQPLLAP